MPEATENTDSGLLLLTLGLVDDEESFRKGKKELDDFKAHLSDLTANVDLSKAIEAVRQFSKLWASLESKALSLSIDVATSGTYNLSPTEMKAVRTNAEGQIAKKTGLTSDMFLANQEAISISQAQVLNLGTTQNTPWIVAEEAARKYNIPSWYGQGLLGKFTTDTSLEVQRSLYDDLLIPLYTELTKAQQSGDRSRQADINRYIDNILTNIPGASREEYEYAIAQYTAGVTRPITAFSSSEQSTGTATSIGEQDKAFATRTATAQSRIDQAKAERKRVFDRLKGQIGTGLLEVRAEVEDLLTTATRIWEADPVGITGAFALPKQYATLKTKWGLEQDKATDEDIAFSRVLLGSTKEGVRSYDASAYHDSLVSRAKDLIANGTATPLEIETAIADATVLHSTTYDPLVANAFKAVRVNKAKQMIASGEAEDLIASYAQEHLSHPDFAPELGTKAREQVARDLAEEEALTALIESLKVEQANPESSMYAGLVERGIGVPTYLLEQAELGNIPYEEAYKMLVPLYNQLNAKLEKSLFGSAFKDAPDVSFKQPTDPKVYKQYYKNEPDYQVPKKADRNALFQLDVKVNGETKTTITEDNPFASLDLSRPIFNSSK